MLHSIHCKVEHKNQKQITTMITMSTSDAEYSTIDAGHSFIYSLSVEGKGLIP